MKDLANGPISDGLVLVDPQMPGGQIAVLVSLCPTDTIIRRGQDMSEQKGDCCSVVP